MAQTSADDERDAGEVPDGGVAAVHVAVEELQALGDLVVGLEHQGHREQDQEREVDEAVHQPGGGVAQQGLHVDAGPEVAQAALHVLRGGGAVVRRPPLPVPHPLAEEDRPVEDQDREDHVEDQLPRARDVPEDHALDVAVLVVELEDRGGHARPDGDQGEEDTDADRDLVRLQSGLHGADRTRPLFSPGSSPSSGSAWGRAGPGTSSPSWPDP